MEMMDFPGTEQQQQAPEPKRPVFLLVLCILTFVFAGFFWLASVTQLASGPSTEKELRKVTAMFVDLSEQMRRMGSDAVAGMYDQIIDQTIQINQHHYGYYAVLFLAVTTGIFGAILMLRRKKLGFHLYIGYSFVYVGLPYLFVTADAIPLVNTIFSALFAGLFIFMYSRNLRWLK